MGAERRTARSEYRATQGGRVGLGVLFCCAALTTAAAATAGSPGGSRELHPGEVVPSIECQGNPEQSYALYLPKSYGAERRWPTIYVLEPAARGSLPLDAMKDAAERYGFILAGSNNSRNGPIQPDLEALQAMYGDTHARLSVDDSRVYFAGFSGGARVASQIALACKCTHGLFLNGAGFNGPAPGKDAALPVFATVGTSDFNFSEMVRLDVELERTGAPHYLRRFEGPHQWAPADVWEDAFSWMAILETKDGRRSRDAAFVDAELARSMARAGRLEASGEAHLALQDYRAIVIAFQGLADLAAAQARIGALKDSPAAREAAKRELADIEKETAVGDGPKRAIAALRDGGGDPLALWAAARSEVERLRDRLAKEKRPEERRLLERAHAGVTALALETGAGYLRDHDLTRARGFFELALASAPDSTWARISLARCLAAQGDRAGAVRELQRAKDAGVEIGDLPARFSELAALAQDPGFQKLLAADETRDAPQRGNDR